MGDYNTSASMDVFCNESMEAIDTMHEELDALIGDENTLRQAAAAKGQGGFQPSEAITSKEGQERLKEITSHCHEKIAESYEHNSEQVMARLASAPSDAASRALQALQMREEVSPSEIAALERTYGGQSHMFDKALDDLAAKRCKGYQRKGRTKFELEADDMAELRERINGHIRTCSHPGKNSLGHVARKSIIVNDIANAKAGKGMGVLGNPARHHN